MSKSKKRISSKLSVKLQRYNLAKVNKDFSVKKCHASSCFIKFLCLNHGKTKIQGVSKGASEASLCAAGLAKVAVGDHPGEYNVKTLLSCLQRHV